METLTNFGRSQTGTHIQSITGTFETRVSQNVMVRGPTSAPDLHPQRHHGGRLLEGRDQELPRLGAERRGLQL